MCTSDSYHYICGVYVVAYSEVSRQHVAANLHKSQPAVYLERIEDFIFADVRRIISFLKKAHNMLLFGYEIQRSEVIAKDWSCTTCEEKFGCERCRKEHYCSVECQAGHRECHEERCKIISSLTEVPLPQVSSQVNLDSN